MSRVCFGIDLGGTSVKIGMFSEKGELLEKWEIPTNKENQQETVPREMAEAVLNKLSERGIAKEDCVGVGVGVPGPVAPDGTVIKCANIAWDIFNVQEVMEGYLGIKVRVSNDANVAALGEYWQGGGRGFGVTVLITLGTGIGGGIVINGKLYNGNNGGAGEIGHMCVNMDETVVCGCGAKGHLEQYASATGIVRLATDELAANPNEQSVLRNGELTAQMVFDAAKSGEALALRVVDKACRYLAMACTGIAACFDPDAFIIGGGVSRAGSIITDTVAKYYKEWSMLALKDVKFVLAELGNDAGIYGSAELVLE